MTDYQKKLEEKKQKLIRMAKYGVLVLTVLATVRGIVINARQSFFTSSTVDGRELPIYCVETKEPEIALTFDAAWGNPDDVKAILADGHDLGNHSENHKNMSQLSDEEKKQELMTVHEKVRTLTGYEMFLFRPPYGDYDNAVVKTAKECGYYTIQWDVDSLDWKDYGVDSILKTVTEHKHLGNGSIILCHNGAKYTADALDTLITTLQEKGYTFVPLSELIYRDQYHMNHEGRQIKN